MDMVEKYKDLGIRGLLEKIFFNLKKFFLRLWYMNRFCTSGKSLVFEGMLDLRGGKGIKLGNNIVFGKNVKLHCHENSKIIIGDGCYIGENVLIGSHKNILIGDNSKIHENTIIAGIEVKLGKNVWVSRYCSVLGTDISIGDDCILAPFVSILDTDHYIEDDTGRITMDAGRTAPVKVGENVWMCNGSKILKGVSIGTGAIIAAGAVVTKDISDGFVAVGVPAMEIKRK